MVNTASSAVELTEIPELFYSVAEVRQIAVDFRYLKDELESSVVSHELNGTCLSLLMEAYRARDARS